MIKWIYTNIFDTATVTSLNAGASNAVANVQDPLLKKTYRSTSLSNQWIKFDHGSAKQVDLFTFFNDNLTSGATVTLYGHASDMGNLESDWASATYKQVISNFDSTVGIILPATSLRWWLLGISDASNTAAYIEIGRVFGGTTISPDENFSEDIQVSLIDPSLQNFTIGSALYSVARLGRREFSFSLNDMSAANQTLIKTLFANVGKTQPFVIAFDTSNNILDWTRYGVFVSDLSFSGTPNNRANVSLVFRELR